MSDWMRRSRLLAWAVMVVSAGVAACDSAVTAPTTTGRGLVSTETTQQAAAVADSDTTSLWTPSCDLTNHCTPTDSVTVAEPGGNVKIGVFDSTTTAKVTVGGNTYKFQLGLTGVGGSFIGILWKNGTFVGYWGYCLFPNAMNKTYKTTDPATGKVYIHWENHELDSANHDTGQMYHYIYDPQTNTLKVYHQKNGTTTLIYQGPPIQSKNKLPPPDPAPGAGPYTGEGQYTNPAPVPATPTGTTTATPTTGTATPTTGTSSTSSTGSVRAGGTSTMLARPVVGGRLVQP